MAEGETNQMKLVKIPLAEALEVPENANLVEVIRNHYWRVSQDHCVYKVIGGSFQCNDNEAVMKTLRNVAEGDTIELIAVLYFAVTVSEHSSGGIIFSNPFEHYNSGYQFVII